MYIHIYMYIQIYIYRCSPAEDRFRTRLGTVEPKIKFETIAFLDRLCVDGQRLSLTTARVAHCD